MAKKEALGRGLGSLLDTSPIISGSSTINEIDITLIQPNPTQPRTHFDEEALEELASSIKEIGIITPITLKKNEDGTYQIIAGERRYRASKLAGIKKIPAYIKTAKDEQVLEMALVENIQREDLNAIEIALSYQRLIDDYKFTQEALSERVGKKRATISNYLRLLKLPAEIQLGLQERKIETGHAKALVSLNDAQKQIALYEAIVKNNYSVRETEKHIRDVSDKNTTPKAPDTELQSKYAESIKQTWGNRIQMHCNEKGKGKLTIAFENEQQLNELLEALKKSLL